MPTKMSAVSVDLDEIDTYRRLHGLPTREQGGSSAVYDLALDRMVRFARDQRLELSLFAVGRDLRREASAERLAALSRAGHPVENHSQSHRHDLARASRAVMVAEVDEAQDVIEQVTGRRPRGFRAPGYAISDTLLEVLEQRGYSFDASVFACPPYFLAKTLAMASIRLRGRRSRAVLDTPRVMLAPRLPYRPARPWWRPGGAGLLELPIAVTRRLRLPLIGTSVTMAGPRGARALARGCADAPLVSFGLHGIDFLDASDGLEDLLGHQPDVNISSSRKLACLAAAIFELRRCGYRFVTLAEAAEELGAQG